MFYSLSYTISVIIALIVAFIIVGIPTGVVLRRLGYSEWWALVMFIPGGALIGLWVLAFARWPGPDVASAK